MAKSKKSTFADAVASYDIGDAQHSRNFEWSIGTEKNDFEDARFYGNDKQTNNMMNAFRKAHKEWSKAKTPEKKEAAIRRAANIYDIFETNNWHRENEQLMSEAAKSLNKG